MASVRTTGLSCLVIATLLATVLTPAYSSASLTSPPSPKPTTSPPSPNLTTSPNPTTSPPSPNSTTSPNLTNPTNSPTSSRLVAQTAPCVPPCIGSPWVNIRPDVVYVKAGTTVTYLVALNTQPTADVTITPTSADSDIATVTEALTFTDANWRTPQTVTVTGVVDDITSITHPLTTSDTNYRTIGVPTVSVFPTKTASISKYEQLPRDTFTSIGVGGFYDRPENVGSLRGFEVIMCGVKSDKTIQCRGSNSHGQATPPEGEFKSVSAGARHVCGIRSDDMVQCWGDNLYGQVNPQTGTFKQVSAGREHTCGIKSDDTLECWGLDNAGQATPPLGNFKQVSAGGFHTCGIKSDDTIQCWGWNDQSRTTPPSDTFKSVSAGVSHTCGIASNDTVKCWGNNFADKATPPSETFKQVSAGDSHTCGIRSDDTLACWGSNNLKQATPPLDTFKQVSAGDLLNCGIKSNDTVQCWDWPGISSTAVDAREGSNGNGELWINLVEPAPAGGLTVSIGYTYPVDGASESDLDNPPTTLTVPSGEISAKFNIPILEDSIVEDEEEFYLKISATPSGWFRQEDHRIRVVIVDDNDSLGVLISPTVVTLEAGTTNTYLAALKSQPTDDVTVTPTSGDTDIATVAVGSNTMTVAEALTFTDESWNTPQTVTVTGVASGSTSITHAVTSSDTLYEGIENNAEVGVPVVSVIPSKTASINRFEQISRDTFSSISVGGVHDPQNLHRQFVMFMCGVNSDKTIQCWGTSTWGQATPPPGDFISVSAGSEHTCGIKSDDSVQCWGLNNVGQATSQSGTFKQVSAGGFHTCGIDSDDLVRCWGWNGNGQATSQSGTFKQVSAGSSHTCGIDSNDLVRCWGYNGSGQATSPSGTFKSVSAGSSHTCGIDSDDLVRCWGWNGQGRATSPSGTFKSVSAGGSHTCGIDSNDLVRCWGWDGNGQATPPLGTFKQVSAGIFDTCGIDADDTLACWGSYNKGATLVGAGEGTNQHAELWINLGEPAPEDGLTVAINYEYPDAGASSFDLDNPPTTLTIPSGKISAKLTIPIVGDSLDEDSEAFVVRISTAASGWSVLAGQVVGVEDRRLATVWITDNDTAGVTVSESSVSITGTGTDHYTVVLDSQPTGNVTITPTSGAANTASVSGALEFTPSNWNMAQSVIVTGVNPGATTITHAATSSDSKYSGITIASVDVSVTGTVGIASTASATEGANATLAVTLSNAAPTGGLLLNFAYGYTGANAAEASDLSSAPTSHTVASGETSGTLTVASADDKIDEDNETLAVTMSTSATSWTVANGQSVATVTITDNDTAGVTVSESSVSIFGTDAAHFTVVLDSEPTAAVTITPTSGATSTASVSGALEFTPSNWSEAQSVTVTGVNAGTTTITHAATSTDTKYSALTIDSVDVTVTAAPPDIKVSRTAFSVDVGATQTYTVVLDSAPTSSVTVTATSEDTTKATVSGQVEFSTTNWNQHQTFTVTGVAAGQSTITHAPSSDDSNYNTISIASLTAIVAGGSRPQPPNPPPGPPPGPPLEDEVPNVAPTFADAGPLNRTVEENSPAGTSVGAPITANDEDGDTLTYSLEGSGTDLFRINSRTGQITVRDGAELDFESETTTYTMTVTATDEDGSGESATIEVVISIEDKEVSSTVDTFDANRDEQIDLTELLASLRAFMNGDLTLPQIIEILRFYLSS